MNNDEHVLHHTSVFRAVLVMAVVALQVLTIVV